MKTNEVQSEHNFAETVELIREAIEASGLKVISVIDAQGNLNKIGIQISGNKILEVFHPKLAKEVLDSDVRAGIVPPIRIYIFEDAGKTHVMAQRAVDLFAPYVSLNDLAVRVDNMLDSAVMSVK